MANFTSDFHTIKPSFPLLDISPNMELLNPFLMDNSSFNFQSLLGFPNDQSAEFSNNFPNLFCTTKENLIPSSQPITTASNGYQESKKGKSIDVSESSSAITSPAVSEKVIKRKNLIKNSGRGKRLKVSDLEDEKLKDVVHVRARRGQATDSHSLAERVRRGKINERLRCLQDIVPGCYKTMGMAVMLDEIINYVQSLQNQVEFLSMKLTAASNFHDFNSETDDMEKLQLLGGAKACEEQEFERMISEEYGGLIACIHSNMGDSHLRMPFAI